MKERVERVVEHHPVEREYVVSGRRAGMGGERAVEPLIFTLNLSLPSPTSSTLPQVETKYVGEHELPASEESLGVSERVVEETAGVCPPTTAYGTTAGMSAQERLTNGCCVHIGRGRSDI